MNKIRPMTTLVRAEEVKVGDSIRFRNDEYFCRVTSVCYDNGRYCFDTDLEESTPAMDKDEQIVVRKARSPAKTITFWWDFDAWLTNQAHQDIAEKDLEDLEEAVVRLLCMPTMRKMMLRSRSPEGAWLRDILETLEGRVSPEVYSVLTSRQVELGPRHRKILEDEGWDIG